MRCLRSVTEAGVVRVPIFMQIGTAGQHRLGAHPDEMRGELIGDLRAAVGHRQHVAARDVDLVGERQRDRVAGLGRLDLAVGDEKARDRAVAAGSGGDDGDRRARCARSGSCRQSRENRGAGRLTHCTGRRNGALRAILLDVDAFEIVEQMRARSTRACAALGDETLSPMRAEIGMRDQASGSRAARRIS